MPRKCAVPGCKSNYDSWLKNNKPVSTFSFPKNESRKQAWIEAIRRKNWKPTKYSGVCVKHFYEKFVIRYQPYKRGEELTSLLLDCPKLSEEAIPQIFNNLPIRNLSRKEPQARKSPNCRRQETTKRHAEKDTVLTMDNSNSQSSICQMFSCDNIVEKYKCRFCDFVSDLQITLNDHIWDHHGKRKMTDFKIRSYLCKICGFMSYSSLVWWVHHDTCTTTSSKSSENLKSLIHCSQCSYKTDIEGSLKNTHDFASHESQRN